MGGGGGRRDQLGACRVLDANVSDSGCTTRGFAQRTVLSTILTTVETAQSPRGLGLRRSCGSERVMAPYVVGEQRDGELKEPRLWFIYQPAREEISWARLMS